MSKSVEIYTTPFCPYCHRAKALLQGKKIKFREIDLYAKPGKRDEMIARAHGQRTVPQIFVDDVHVGNCDEIVALDRQGKLDAILGIEP